MNNEDYARHLCCSGCNNYVCYTNKKQCQTLKDLLTMAEWKDEQHAQEKKEIDEQWKRLMAESKSIGVDLLQRKDEQHAKEKQQLIDKACNIISVKVENYINFYGDNDYSFDKHGFMKQFKKAMKGE